MNYRFVPLNDSNYQSFYIKNDNLNANCIANSFIKPNQKNKKESFFDFEGQIIKDAIRTIIENQGSCYVFSMSQLAKIEYFFESMGMTGCWSYTNEFDFCFRVKGKRKFTRQEQEDVYHRLQRRGNAILG